MAFTDFLFNGTPPPSTTSETISQQNLPDWYQDYLRALIAQSSAIAGEPYSAYPGQRIAPLTSDQLSAYDQARANLGTGQANYATAQNMVKQGGTYDPSQLDQYMSPYISNVNDIIAQRGQRNLTENLLPAVNQTFTGAGQFGSTRNADFTQRAVRDTNESILAQQAQALQTGFEQANMNYSNWAAKQQAGGIDLSNISDAQRAAQAQDVASQEAIGQTLQGQNQQSLDLAYQDFLNQQQYPQQQASFMSDIIRGMQMPTSTDAYAVGQNGSPGASPLTQLASLYGVYRGITAPTTTTPGH